MNIQQTFNTFSKVTIQTFNLSTSSIVDNKIKSHESNSESFLSYSERYITRLYSSGYKFHLFDDIS